MSDSPVTSVLSSPETFSKGIPQHSFEQFEELVHNVVSLRRDLFQRYLDPRRNIDKECGFPDTMSADQYWELYQRDAIAARVVECVPRAVWQKQPTVYEDEDPDSQTPFEEAWDNISKAIRGERSYYQDEGGNPVMSVLERADILSGIGQYGVILLGLDDGLDLREPVAGVEEKYSMPVKVTKKKPMPKPKVEGEGAESEGEAVPAGKKPKGQYSLNWRASPPRPGAKFSIALNTYVQPKSPRDYDGVKEYESFPKDETEADEPESDLDGLDSGDDAPSTTCRKLLYLRPFPEASAQITHYENNPTCPRYGQPTQYLITFNDSRESSWQGMRTVAPQHQRQVHWTRIVHIPSDGRLASDVFGTERLRQVYRHVLSLQKLYHGDGEMYWKGAFPGISFETHPQLGGQVQLDQSAVRGQIEQYQNGLQRFLLSMGMTAKMLSPTVADPTPHIEAQLGAIAIRIGIPKRILMGSERGELSSAQDAGEWDDTVGAWQVNDRNPRIVIPAVDRLINVGCLPEPCGYSIDWPEITTAGETERAQIALTLTQAMVAYLQGNGPSFIAPMDYLTEVWQLDDARAQSIIDNAEAIAEQLALEQEEEMLAQLDMQEDQLARGLIPDPNDPDLIPDMAPGGGNPFGGGGPPNGKPPGGGFPPKNGKPPAFNFSRNAFCPTGEGGGVDPSCSPSKVVTTDQTSPHVGKVWTNGRGERREVKSVMSVGGNPRLAIQTDDRNQFELVHPDEFEKLYERETKRVEKPEPVKRPQEEVDRDSARSEFLSEMTPLKSAKAREALSVTLINGGMPYQRQELVEKLVGEGAEPTPHAKDGRRLSRPDGSYLSEKQISKTAMDYAAFLVRKKKPAMNGAAKIVKEIPWKRKSGESRKGARRG